MAKQEKATGKLPELSPLEAAEKEIERLRAEVIEANAKFEDRANMDENGFRLTEYTKAIIGIHEGTLLRITKEQLLEIATKINAMAQELVEMQS
jgi:hypothetical protein